MVTGLVHGIHPELVPPIKIQGMVSQLTEVRGVRREFEERLTRKEMHWLEVHCQIYGLSPINDGSQEYMYSSRSTAEIPSKQVERAAIE